MFVAEVNGRPGDGYVAVRVTGDVDTGTRAALTDALERALAVGSPSILVDLTGVRFFAVAGVHCVERAVGALEARGGSAHVVCPQPGAAWRVVSLLGLQQQWLVHHDVDAAVAGCTAGRWPSSAPVRGGDEPAEVAGRHVPVGTAGPGGPVRRRVQG
ncbi:anti-anti-sigma factor [Pseudonocardia hierapolitana]|uniref:Anti-anti-sigma factor n=1 Tax=Pseudonocardia hierapolitana TaxID=1128676 RepID=A0A561SH26_9PSEU|nr:anti-anti-sigma factor [Pseudonocardia hierapolitana]